MHPILFAALFIVYLVSENLDEQIPAGDILEVAGVVLLGATAALLLLISLLRDAAWAGMVTTILIVWMFAFGDFRGLLSGTEASTLLLVLLWSTAAFISLIVVAVLRSRLATASTTLNVVAAALLMVNLMPVVPRQIATAMAPRYQPPGLESLHGLPADKVEQRRDIYYIVPDRYPSQATLGGPVFDFDNSEFIAELEQRGFYVAHESYANYISTAMSLASSLNMTYLELEEMRDVTPAPDDPKPIHDTLAGSLAVPAFLKAHGYTYVQVPSWYAPTAAGAEVDIRLRYQQLTEFAEALYESTVVPDIATTVGLEAREDPYIANTLYQFERLMDTQALSGPKFVVAHILVPHPPFVFDASGPLPPAARINGVEDVYPARFVDQIEYTNRRMLEVIDHLQRRDEGTDPIIIIQADEGPHLAEAPRDWRHAASHQYQHKFGILNAYYMPGLDDTPLYPSITPVNTFRVVFNEYFNADLPLLDDRVRAFPNPSRLYEEIDITARLPQRGADRQDIDPHAVDYEVTPPKTWTAGVREAYPVTVKNSGDETWPVEQTQLWVRFADRNNGSVSRLERFAVTADVVPGESHTISVSILPPDTAGEYVLSHTLAGATTSFASAPESSIRVEADAETWEDVLSAAYNVEGSGVWDAGDIRKYMIVATNTGSYTWNATGAHPVRLGIHFGGDSDEPHTGWATDQRFDIARDVPPGDTATWTVEVRAPREIGSYVLRHRMVKEGIAWFDDVARVHVTVQRQPAFELPVLLVALTVAVLGAAVLYAFAAPPGVRQYVDSAWRRIRGAR